MLKVGELAALANLTVRTLHHYDSIGLLRPSARSDAGYRLYARDDVARLQQIQAMRALGMSLADIGLALDSPENDPLAIVERQLAALDERIAEAHRMRAQLLRVRGQLAAGVSPDLSTWLTTLEMTMSIMNVYERYLTKDELARLPLYRDAGALARWQTLVEQASGLMQSGTAPDSDAAKAFGRRWLDTFERDTGGDAALMAKINAMAAREQEAVGLPGPVMDYVFAAIGELKYDTWAKYLRPEIVARMRRHSETRGAEWITLVSEVHERMALDPDAASPQAAELARRWMALFHDMVGSEQQDVDAFRRATAQEPLLRAGPGIDDRVIGWLKLAMRM